MFVVQAIHKKMVNEISIQPQHPQPLNSCHPISYSSANTSVNQYVPSQSEPKKHEGSIANRPETCHFKIRNFSSNKTNYKNSYLQGRQIDNVMIVNGNKAKKLENNEETAHYYAKKCNELDFNKNKEKRIIKSNKQQKKNSSIFNQIEIFKSIEKSDLSFHSYNFSSFNFLAHRPNIRLNELYQPEMLEQSQLILIISFSLLNQQPKVFCKSQEKRYYSQKTIESQKSNVYSTETMNLLRMLSEQKSNKSLFESCQLFYKVRNEEQMHFLEQYLQQNNLNHYTGIINVESKHSQQYNIYSLKTISTKNSMFMLVEDESTLISEFPYLEQQKAIFMVPKLINYSSVTHLIMSLREMQHYQPSSPIKSTYKNMIQDDDTFKENICPNISHLRLMKNSNKKCNIFPTPAKTRQQKNGKLSLSGKIRIESIQLNEGGLSERAKQCQQMRQMKQMLKEIKNKSLGDRQPSLEKLSVNNKTGRERSISKNKQEAPNFEGNQKQINLEGEFKEKLYMFAKILENQKRTKLQPKRHSGDLVKEIKQTDRQLQDLTQCLTSKLKSKTPYQMVGDLLRNNAHIGRQVGKYISQVAPVSNYIQNIQKQTAIQSIHSLNNIKSPLSLTIHKYV